MTDSATAPDFPPHSEDPEARGDARDRRTFLKGLAIAGVAVPFAAACGAQSNGATNTGAAAPPNGSGGPHGVLTAASAVPVGGGVIVASAGTVVTQPAKGTFEGFSSTCTHEGCLLHDVTGGTINCNCHLSKFSIQDGSVVSGPATRPLPKRRVKAVGRNIVAG